MEDAVVDAVEDAEEDEEKDEAVAAVVAPTSHAPFSDTPMICLIFKAGVLNEANADTLIAPNGVAVVVTTSITLATGADTDWPDTTTTRYGPIELVFQHLVVLATATSSSALADGVGWNPIEIIVI